jgi:hypothetical protein
MNVILSPSKDGLATSLDYLAQTAVHTLQAFSLAPSFRI